MGLIGLIGLMGRRALLLALAGWGAAAVLAFVAPRRASARRAVVVAAACLSVAVAALGTALARGDWSLTYVADYASRDTPWPYRVSALWAGMAGSLLVWTWLFGLWTVLAARLGRGVEVLAPLGLVLTGLLVWATPPFATLQIPAIDGAGLTPVLRHPAMLYHPLLLYAGQVGLAVPFAVCLAGRARRSPVDDWLPVARRLTLVSLSLLGVAMVAGAHWAYVELGWGGYWAWDPVENSALLPWLAGVGFVHVARRPSDTGTAAARFACGAFVLGLAGAFLTRSGATGSVHAFAEAATVGRVLAATLVATIVAVVAVEWRRRAGETRRPDLSPILSRERAMGTAAVVLAGVVVVVGFGTALPLVRGDDVLVSGRYFAAVTWPFALIVLALAGVGPRLRWGATPPAEAVRRLVPALVAVPAALLAWRGLESPAPLAVVAAGLGGAAAALTVAEIVERRGRQASALVAHLGVAVLLVGVVGTSTGTHRSGVLRDGHVLRVRGYTLALERVVAADAEGPGAAVRADVAVFRGESGDQRVATLRPKAMLSGVGQRVSVAGLRSTPAEDLQVTLRAVGPDGRDVVVDARVVPLAQAVWWGGLLLAAGLAWAAVVCRRRAGVRLVQSIAARETRDGRADAADGGPQPRARAVHEVQGRP